MVLEMKRCPACGKVIDDGFDVCSPICAENVKKLSNPVFFAEKICRRILYPKQVEFLEAIFREKQVAGLFSRQCVVKDTKVMMADESEKSIQDIVPGDKILSIDKNSEIQRDIVANVWSAGIQDVFELRTKIGTIQATKQHKFLTSKGWYKLRSLKPGMKMGFPAHLTMSRELERVNDISFIDLDSIGESMPKQVWDLETENLRNYIANNFVCHNSGKTEVISIAALFAAIILNEQVGIFAPKLEQATKISFRRIKNFVKDSFWLSGYVVESRAAYITFIGGGSITALSASDQSHIEGHTFDRMFCEEAQDISNYMFFDVITPMGAHTNASVCKIGVPKFRGHFYDSVHKGEYYVVKSHWKDHPSPKYRKYVKDKKKEMPVAAFGSQFELKWNTKEGSYFEPGWLEKAKELGKKYNLELIDREKPEWSYGTGIDPAKKIDETAMVVLAYIPDYDVYYPCHLLGMHGRDYPDQAGCIRSILVKQFPMSRNTVCVDTQGTESMVDMLNIAGPNKIYATPTSFEVKTKERLYENFSKALINGRFALPIDRTPEMLRLIEQLYDLQVQFTIHGNKRIHHPKGKSDDWPDGIVLAYEALTAGGQAALFGDDGMLSTEGAYKQIGKEVKEEEKKKLRGEKAKEEILTEFYFV